jgi:hypothetical protein
MVRCSHYRPVEADSGIRIGDLGMGRNIDFEPIGKHESDPDAAVEHE